MSSMDKIHDRDKYMPCLMARLCDMNPDSPTEQMARGISIQRLKEDILANIALILNSSSHLTAEEMNNDDELCSSVLGMGLEDFCGCSHSQQKRKQLQQQIVYQLQKFEPRLFPDSIEVNLVDIGEVSQADLTMEIKARIRAAE